MSKVFIFDVDGTLTPSRLPMTKEFQEFFKEWIKETIMEQFFSVGDVFQHVSSSLQTHFGFQVGVKHCSRHLSVHSVTTYQRMFWAIKFTTQRAFTKQVISLSVRRELRARFHLPNLSSRVPHVPRGVFRAGREKLKERKAQRGDKHATDDAAVAASVPKSSRVFEVSTP